jgi:hypothetical protein
MFLDFKEVIRSVLNISGVCESCIPTMPIRVYNLQVAVIQDCQSRVFLLRAKKSQYQRQPVYRTHRSPPSSPLKIQVEIKYLDREGGREATGLEFAVRCPHVHT